MIVGIIRPDMLKAVKKSLDASDFNLFVTDMKVRAGQEEVVQIYRGSRVCIDLLPEIEVSVIVNDEDVGRVAATIATAAHVSEIPGSKVLAVPVEELYGSEPEERKAVVHEERKAVVHEIAGFTRVAE